MTLLRRTLMLIALTQLGACSTTPLCPMEGQWAVTELGCSKGAGRLDKGLEATYTITGDQGVTRWTMPGCTVEAQFTLESDGARMHVREQGHTCTTTAVAEGASETPCCESAEVNIPLTYTCYSAPGRRDWIAKLSPEGEDTGPWADRGPWRGCRPGDVGMMRLERVR